MPQRRVGDVERLREREVARAVDDRPVGTRHRAADQAVSRAANRRWWDADADDYHREHGSFLGDADFVWCPENLREQDVQLLGDATQLAGARILEVGCGSAPCARYLAAHGAQVVAFDLSRVHSIGDVARRMLLECLRRLRLDGRRVHLVDEQGVLPDPDLGGGEMVTPLRAER